MNESVGVIVIGRAIATTCVTCQWQQTGLEIQCELFLVNWLGASVTCRVRLRQASVS